MGCILLLGVTPCGPYPKLAMAWESQPALPRRHPRLDPHGQDESAHPSHILPTAGATSSVTHHHMTTDVREAEP